MVARGGGGCCCQGLLPGVVVVVPVVVLGGVGTMGCLLVSSHFGNECPKTGFTSWIQALGEASEEQGRHRLVAWLFA